MSRRRIPAIRWALLLAVAAGAAWALMDRPRLPPVSPEPIAADPLLGRRTYANCQACHGIDGRGIAGYAPGLIGAASLAGDGRAAVLKLLVGGGRADGFSAIMPGFARLGDDELAAVLTYIRASWGNVGDAVTPALVGEVRAQVADPRRRP